MGEGTGMGELSLQWGRHGGGQGGRGDRQWAGQGTEVKLFDPSHCLFHLLPPYHLPPLSCPPSAAFPTALVVG